MQKYALAMALIAAFSTPVLAQDGAASEAETTSVTEAIAAFNCELGGAEIEKEDTNVFEIDDAKCQGGQYDIKLNAQFEVTSLTRD